jgi:hypothetical protein
VPDEPAPLLAEAARGLTLADEPAVFQAVLEGEADPPAATALDQAALRG